MPSPTIPPVPVPPGPTTPTGGTGGGSLYYGLPDGYATGQPLNASDLDNLVNLLDNVGAGALAAIGAGTITGGDSSGHAGLTLSLNAWRGILPQAASRFGFAPGLTAAQALVIPASTAFVVWAAPVAGTFPDANATPYDTAETGAAQLVVVTDGSSPDGGLPLLSGASSASALSGLTDLRSFVGTAALAAALAAQAAKEAADVAALESVLGADYFPGSGPAPLPVDVRLDALEGAGGPAEEVDYWDGEARSSTDPTTLPAYIAAQIPAPGPPVTLAPLAPDLVVANQIKSCFAILEVTYAIAYNAAGGGAAGVGAGQAAARAYQATLLDMVLVRPGITDPALIDAVNTTAPLNTTTGVIG